MTARRCGRGDGLTGALTRQAFLEQARDPADDKASHRGWAALCYIDLDGFKRVNDVRGHAAGDILLQRFAWQVQQNIRTADLFARIGGDEFLLLLRVPTQEEARQAAERLHGQLSTAMREQNVAFSLGALLFDRAATLTDEAKVAMADKLMYQAKQAGGGVRAAVLGPKPSPAMADRRSRDRLSNDCFVPAAA